MERVREAWKPISVVLTARICACEAGKVLDQRRAKFPLRNVHPSDHIHFHLEMFASNSFLDDHMSFNLSSVGPRSGIMVLAISVNAAVFY